MPGAKAQAEHLRWRASGVHRHGLEPLDHRVNQPLIGQRAGQHGPHQPGFAAPQPGATVQLLDMETDDEVRYQIVGDDEADIKLGKVSVNSPIARALIGKEAGDVAEVQAPGGLREYEVLDVQYL